VSELGWAGLGWAGRQCVGLAALPYCTAQLAQPA